MGPLEDIQSKCSNDPHKLSLLNTKILKMKVA